jgi:site-specific DNA-methyltransferase (adenine-specific)
MNKLGPDLIDKILHRNCVEGMKMLPDACIPMSLTSPPYEAIRGFGGHDFGPQVFEAIARELWRITTIGGVVCWVVADQIKGTYSGTSFRQALFFQEIGFRLHDVLIMNRRGCGYAGGNRYGKVEFAFVLSKGRPRSIHLIRDKENSHAGQLRRFRAKRPDGSIRYSAVAKPIAAVGLRGPVWEYHTGNGCTTRDRYAHMHTALMHEDMARDLIESWSEPGDLIFDPMCGAGTTCKMALLSHRAYLGFEIHKPYHRLAVRRMNDAHAEYRRRLDTWLVGA